MRLMVTLAHPAADSHDLVDKSHLLAHSVEKLAEKLGVDLYRR